MAVNPPLLPLPSSCAPPPPLLIIATKTQRLQQSPWRSRVGREDGSFISAARTSLGADPHKREGGEGGGGSTSREVQPGLEPLVCCELLFVSQRLFSADGVAPVDSRGCSHVAESGAVEVPALEGGRRAEWQMSLREGGGGGGGMDRTSGLPPEAAAEASAPGGPPGGCRRATGPARPRPAPRRCRSCRPARQPAPWDPHKGRRSGWLVVRQPSGVVACGGLFGPQRKQCGAVPAGAAGEEAEKRSRAGRGLCDLRSA